MAYGHISLALGVFRSLTGRNWSFFRFVVVVAVCLLVYFIL